MKEIIEIFNKKANKLLSILNNSSSKITLKQIEVLKALALPEVKKELETRDISKNIQLAIFQNLERFSDKGTLTPEITKLALSAVKNTKTEKEFLNKVIECTSKNGYLEETEMLLNAGANIETVSISDHKKTLLLLTAERGYKELSLFLISLGANIEAKDDNENTALLLASKNGHADIVFTLINAGANIEAEDNCGNTALLEAAENGNAKVLDVLIKNRANLEVKSSNERTAITLAVFKDSPKCVELLANAGANLEQCHDKKTTGYFVDRDFKTPLIIAAERGLSEIVDILIDAGANIHAKDWNGYTAKDWAELRKHKDIVETLEKAENANYSRTTNNTYKAVGLLNNF